MNTSSLFPRLKCAVVLIIFTVLGLGPVPITSVVGLFVVIFRPQWFKNLVDRIYGDK
ncbi:conserved hypothetical protein [Crenothrix polyspora]|uniref:Uncharacterized protein n=1 Tax=Crenothrix polyspora TaxID=360316 RepID=A0A1R4H3F2_9GAMM|nr:conserved hypothetical protein [Crenothrix polyspora]